MAIRIGITEQGVSGILGKIGKWVTRTAGACERTTGKLAHELRRDIVTGIRKQAPGGLQFKPLADSTKAMKGSSKALIDHGDLIRSVNVTKLGSLSYFVGVHRSVVSPGGQPMWNIAEIHEFGSKKVKNRPPARPFLIPSFNAWRYGVEQRFAEMVARDIGLPFRGALAGAISKPFGEIVVGGDIGGEGGGEGGD